MKIQIYIGNSYSQISQRIPEVIKACTLQQAYYQQTIPHDILSIVKRARWYKGTASQLKGYIDKLISQLDISDPIDSSYLAKIVSENKDFYALNKKLYGIYGKPERKVRQRIYYRNSDNSFPTGWLFSKIIPVLKQLNLEYELIDKRQSLEYKLLNIELPFGLREYQKVAIDKAVKTERGILHLPTGSGKTAIAAMILAQFGLPTLYIVPSLLLIEQTVKEFRKWFKDDIVGMIGEGVVDVKLINVATQQTLWSRHKTDLFKQLVENTKVLIIDEAHKVEKPQARSKHLGNTWYRVAMQMENARIRLALTATPGKEGQYSRELLEGVTGRIIYRISVSELIKLGYLSPVKVYIYEVPVERTSRKWKEAYSVGILNNTARNIIIAKLARKYAEQGKRVLVVVDRITSHGQRLYSLLSDCAEVLYGNANRKRRAEVLQAFKTRKVPVLISTLIKEGVDIPELEVVILANAGKGGENGRKLLQTIGRGLRIASGKQEAIIIDFFDKDKGLLQKHSRERIRKYKEEEMFEIEYKTMGALT